MGSYIALLFGKVEEIAQNTYRVEGYEFTFVVTMVLFDEKLMRIIMGTYN